MDDCLFCRIVRGEIPCDRVYEDEDVLAFKDIAPMAPVHVLIIPKRHADDAASLTGDMAFSLARAVGTVAQKAGVAKSGYRLISNVGEDGCQSVKHMHIHMLGGKKLPEKMA